MPQTPKHIPRRMCAICREQFPKRELIRLVRTADGQVEIDETGKKSGRGAYVCKAPGCIAQAQKGARLEKAIGVKVSPEVFHTLKEMVEHEP